MTWSFPKMEHARFERNPLVAVVVQLRFHPILKIADRVSDFQEKIRPAFPVFLEGTSELVSFKPPDIVNVRKERQFSFQKEDGACSILLGVGALSLENRRHTGHAAFLKEVKLAVDALNEVYKPIKPNRLGLRYINLIDKEHISRDLGRDVAWEELITEEFLRMPAELADLDSTLFANEISSRVNGGSLTLRYGLLPRDERGGVHFRFDADRYCEDLFDVTTVMDKLFSFVADVYSPFAMMAGPTLRQWMKPLEGAARKISKED
jgi:uncharacterized protein (TIGR04255 family)